MYKTMRCHVYDQETALYCTALVRVDCRNERTSATRACCTDDEGADTAAAVGVGIGTCLVMTLLADKLFPLMLLLVLLPLVIAVLILLLLVMSRERSNAKMPGESDTMMHCPLRWAE